MTKQLSEVSERIGRFPATRYMGSKKKLLNVIWESARGLDFSQVMDPFGGSGVVSYLFKSNGFPVHFNDHMFMNYHFGRALIENSATRLSDQEIGYISNVQGDPQGFISRTFRDLYFSEEDNAFLDAARKEIDYLEGYKKDIALTALGRACLKKRPRGIFTYTGNRYEDGRRDLALDLRQHFSEQSHIVNNAVFDNGTIASATNADALKIKPQPNTLIYLDPPYFSLRSDNDYVRRYHFVEGLMRNWDGLEIQEHTKTKKFKSYYTPFSTKAGTYAAFEKLFALYKDNPILLSYSSNSVPTLNDLLAMFNNEKRNVEVLSVDHLYSFGTQRNLPSGQRNRVQEYIFRVE